MSFFLDTSTAYHEQTMRHNSPNDSCFDNHRGFLNLPQCSAKLPPLNPLVGKDSPPLQSKGGFNHPLTATSGSGVPLNWGGIWNPSKRGDLEPEVSRKLGDNTPQGPASRLAGINDEESGVSRMSNLVHIRSHLRRIIKKLSLLKMFKGQNRRIKCLCELAYKYRKMLTLGGFLNISSSPPGMNVVSEDPPRPKIEVVLETAMDVPDSATEIEKVTIDKEIEAKSSVKTSLEASSSELYEAFCLKGLPQRLHMPAPKMLCRPSSLRWVKPCCTRSCNVTLEHVATICYSEYRKLHPELNQLD